MSEIDRRQFGALAFVGGILSLIRAARAVEGKLPPARAHAAVPEGTVVWVDLSNGGRLRRICRRGYWVTEGSAA